MFYAARAGKIEVVEKLIHEGAEVNKTNKWDVFITIHFAFKIQMSPHFVSTFAGIVGIVGL